MRTILSASKAAGRVLSSRQPALETLASCGAGRWNRSLSRSARGLIPAIEDRVVVPAEFDQFPRYLSSSGQIRRFLGCGDGEEGNVLAKTYEERRLIGYSPEQLFAVVEAVDMYEDFLPWCQRSKVVRRNSDGSFDAELEIGFKFLVESYVSHVEVRKPKYIKVASMFFKEVVSMLVGSFTDRCRRIYGPAIPVLENSYGQGV
ncbi:polyketide cyclase / dehydrase and lipid transport protein isoform X2 [Wolffia australiana]